MSEICLGTLRMIQRTMSHGATGDSEGQRATVEETAASVPVFGSLINDLIETGKYIVGKLDLSYGSGASISHAYRETKAKKIRINKLLILR